MRAETLKKNVTISLPINLINKLKHMNDQKQISGIGRFCSDAILKSIEDFDHSQKLKLMEQAAHDPDFIARCEEIQQDFNPIDYPEKTGNSEW